MSSWSSARSSGTEGLGGWGGFHPEGAQTLVQAEGIQDDSYLEHPAHLHGEREWPCTLESLQARRVWYIAWFGLSRLCKPRRKRMRCLITPTARFRFEELCLVPALQQPECELMPSCGHGHVVS